MGSCEGTHSYAKYGTGSGDQDCPQTIEKERDDHEAVETLKVVCTVAAVAMGVALVGWGLPKLVGALGEKIVKILMKAPGRGFLIFREDFELNPAAYFRSLLPS